MLVVVLIVITCALFCVWSWVKTGRPFSSIFLGALPHKGIGQLASGLKAKFDPKVYLTCYVYGNNYRFLLVLAVWSRVKTRESSPPTYPGALPLIGHAHLSLSIRNPQELWEFENKLYQFASENGGITKVLIVTHPLYVITDFEDSLVVANACLDKPYMYNFLKLLYNSGLLTADVPTWKPHRRLLSPLFHQKVLNTFVHIYDAQAKILVSELACEVGQSPFNVEPYLCKNVMKSVYRATLGKNSNEESIDIYAHATEMYFHLVLKRIRQVWLHLQFTYNMSTMKTKNDKLMEIVKRITSTVINERKSELKLNQSLGSKNNTISDNFKPLISGVLDLNEKPDVNLTDEEIRGHLDTIIAAAFDSTTKAVTLCLIIIGSHQDTQNKLYKELQEVLEEEDKEVDVHDLTKLVYLEAVVKESLRLFPPAPRIGRAVNSPVQLKYYTLPANSTCLISLHYINRDTKLWGADADKFRPERWMDPSTLPDNSNAFATFSLGRRNCIGKQYAIMAMKIYLANILRRYRVTGDINKLETTCDLFLNPINGHHISLELRK